MRKKLFVFLTAALLLVTPILGACNRDGGEKIDTSKTQLRVYNYDGGIGTAWLKDVKARFEEEFKDVSFQDGKTGAQILIEEGMDQGPAIRDKMRDSTNNVFFGERLPYYQMASSGLLLDISDIVTETLAKDGVSIERKLSEGVQKTAKAHGGKYYGLPHYEAFRGVVYDEDTFDYYGLYKTETGWGYSTAANITAGPDGEKGTADDGLPATQEEFLALCQKMSSNMTPFIWSGSYSSTYFEMLTEVLTDARLGYDAINVPYHFNANEENISSNIILDSAKPDEVTPTVVTKENGYLLWQQEAVYRALDVSKKILNNSDWYERKGNGAYNSVSSTLSNIGAQENFLLSFLEKAEKKPIGMLIEGNYWENEAVKSGAYEHAEKKYPGKGNQAVRKFSFMPVPGRIDKDSSRTTELVMRDYMEAYGVINGNIQDEDIKTLAKKFLQYCYTDRSLADFTVSTGMTRALIYDLTAQELAKLSHFSQSIWNYRKEAKVINTCSDDKFYLTNRTMFVTEFWKSQIGGTSEYHAMDYLRGSGSSAKTYFDGMKKNSADWAQLVSLAG